MAEFLRTIADIAITKKKKKRKRSSTFEKYIQIVRSRTNIIIKAMK